ncbi:MAG: hypothetical protein CM1200mP35_03370 [Chloroflexota bacterium]|nr:MAG: hypothetical protein CM1200mP35_03370 [Chloroflexota bacterium]
MRERASRIWEVSLDDVDYVDGGVQHKSDTELRLTLSRWQLGKIILVVP